MKLIPMIFKQINLQINIYWHQIHRQLIQNSNSMDQENLNNQHIKLEDTIQAVQEEAIQKKKVVQKEIENDSHENRKQSNQKLSIKSYKSQKMTYQSRARFFKTRSEKEQNSSAQILSNMSQKLEQAKINLNFQRKMYEIHFDSYNKWAETYNFSLKNNSKQIQFIAERVKKIEKQLEIMIQKLDESNAELKKLEKAYEKQTETHQKMLMKSHMI